MRAILLLLGVSLSVVAQTLPPDAAALKANRDAEVARINVLYARSLEKCQKRALADGDLSGANAIEKEIAIAAPDPFSLREILVSKEWEYGDPGRPANIATFNKDGTVDLSLGGKAVWRWRVVDQYTLKVDFNGGGGCSFRFPEDLKTLNIQGSTEKGGARHLKPLD